MTQGSPRQCLRRQGFKLSVAIILFISAGAVYLTTSGVGASSPGRSGPALRQPVQRRSEAKGNAIEGETGTSLKAQPLQEPIVRPQRAAFSRRPTVAWAGIRVGAPAADGRRAAEAFSDAAGAVLVSSGLSPVEWVDRMRIEAAVAELATSAMLGSQTTDALRIGRWVNADLLLWGELDDKSLHLRVASLSHGDVVAQATLEAPRGLEQVGLELLAERAAGLLNTAMQRLAHRHERRVLAPLVFQNIGPTDRLDHLESLFVDTLAAVAERDDGVDVLRFAAATEGREEAELGLLGLTERDADAWMRLADFYLWGSFAELPPRQANSDAGSNPVELTVNLWDGGGEVVELSRQTTVAGAEAALRELMGEAAAVAGGALSEMLSADARDRAVGRLQDRVDQLGEQIAAQSQRDKRIPTTPWGIGVHGYRLKLAEIACFLAPSSWDAWRRMIELRASGTRIAGENQFARNVAWLDFREHALRVWPRAKIKTWDIEQLAYFSDHIRPYWPKLVGYPAGDDDAEPLRLLREQVLDKVFAYNEGPGAEVTAAEACVLFKTVCDAHTTNERRLDAVLTFWPMIKHDYAQRVREDPYHQYEEDLFTYSHPRIEEFILDILEKNNRLDLLDELFWLEVSSSSGPAVPLDAQRGRTPAAAPAAVVHPCLQGPSSILDPTPDPLRLARLLEAIPPTALPLPEPMSAAAWAQKIGVPVLTFPFPCRVGESRRDAYGPYLSYFYMHYGPSWTAPVRVSRRAAVRDVTVCEDALWVAAEVDGVLHFDPADDQLVQYGLEAGLRSRSPRGLSRGSGALLVYYDEDEAVVSRWDAQQQRFIDLALPVGDGDAVLPLATCGRWVFYNGQDPHCFDLDAERSISASQWAGERFDMDVGKIVRYQADETGVWLISGRGLLLHYDPRTDQARHWPLPQRGDYALAAAGDWLWLMPVEAQRPRRMPGARWRAHRGRPADAEHLILMHWPSGRYVAGVEAPPTLGNIMPAPGLSIEGTSAQGTYLTFLCDDDYFTYDMRLVFEAAGLPLPPDAAAVQARWASEMRTRLTGDPPLIQAALDGDTKRIQALLDASADVNAINRRGWAAADCALAQGHAACVRLLLDRGGRMYQRGRLADFHHNVPRTAAWEAGYRGHEEALGVLMEVLTADEREGRQRRNLPPAVPNQPDDSKVESLAQRMGEALMGAMEAGRDALRVRLMEAGADLTLTTFEPKLQMRLTPLMMAIERNDLALMEALLDRGADPHQRVPGVGMIRTSWSSIGLAVQLQRVAHLRAMLGRGADPLHRVSPQAKSALEEALQSPGRQWAVTLMLQSPAIRDREDRWAQSIRLEDIYGVLHGGPGGVALLHRLHEAGLPLEAPFYAGTIYGDRSRERPMQTLFSYAAYRGRSEAMQALIDMGVDLDQSIEGVRQGDLALIRAAEGKRFDLVADLLRLGYDLNAKDEMGITPLIGLTLTIPKLKGVQQLLALGQVDVTARDNKGRSAEDIETDASIKALLAALTPANVGENPPAPARPAPWLAAYKLHQAIRDNDVASARKLLATTVVDFTVFEGGGEDSLRWAVEMDRPEIARLILQANDHTQRPLYWNRSSALNDAAYYNRPWAVDLLLKLSDADKRRMEGRLGIATALKTARERGFSELAGKLEVYRSRYEAFYLGQ